MIRLISEDSPDVEQGPDLGEVVRKIFEPDGILQKTLDFEFRQEQADMAKRVHDCLQEGEHLLFEAGTGVGKSLASTKSDLVESVNTHVIFRRPPPTPAAGCTRRRS